MPRTAIESQVCCDFANDRREFETMAGKSAAKNDVSVTRIAVDHKIAIRREAVHAGLRFAKTGGGSRHPRVGRARHGFDIASRIDVAIEFIGRR